MCVCVCGCGGRPTLGHASVSGRGGDGHWGAAWVLMRCLSGTPPLSSRMPAHIFNSTTADCIGASTRSGCKSRRRKRGHGRRSGSREMPDAKRCDGVGRRVVEFVAAPTVCMARAPSSAGLLPSSSAVWRLGPVRRGWAACQLAVAAVGLAGSLRRRGALSHGRRQPPP